ncbi:hypothetical protein M2132_001089 [Dysgonomonas sp. PH5-45]|uniref:GSCFA domain-containing protein n=1 Tax=unclassified Dysgonomonas TaxID=2630389 RepID=UPI002474D778|nr:MULTISPECIES: GSCFA domain-containing protein [unclassified Dysgonomonas]MDH6354758.1 hypothetical protein [Dysgonomonas sp. PH5-45]MDH6387657.1 hypothetical protein [Dysgonomonas sp. PH5-37]
MNFRTEIEISKSPVTISHQTSVLLLGSCFVESIGNRLLANKFDVCVNPFGIQYNPLSIYNTLELALSGKIFDDKDIFLSQGLYHSFTHHGDFSHKDKSECLDKINDSCKILNEKLKTADVMFITFGTSYAYTEKKSGGVVANCHKLPANMFTRKRLSVYDIVDSWTKLIVLLRNINPQIQIIFTVSPIRHWRDGMHDNQLSKATLLLAVDSLREQIKNVYYFPSYELLLDDLRDYRFYAEDMVHPNDMAVQYIWEKFRDAYFGPDTKQVVDEWQKILKAVNHRPFNEDTCEHQQFLRQTLLRIDGFVKKYPYFHCEEERLTLQKKLLTK